MASHLRCLLFHGNGDFRGRVLARLGGLYKTHNAGIGKKHTGINGLADVISVPGDILDTVYSGANLYGNFYSMSECHT